MLNSITRQQVYLGLVDILFAYAYNHRVTEGELNVSIHIPILAFALQDF